MRTVVSTSGSGESWLQEAMSIPRVQNALSAFLGKSVLWIDSGFSERIKSFVATQPGDVATIFVDYLRLTPQAYNRKPREIDFTLDDSHSFETASHDPKFIAALDLHTRMAEIGELRDAVFDRTFGHLLSCAKGFELRDQYAFENFLDPGGRTGLQWLIEKALVRTPLSVTIHTVLPESSKSSKPWIAGKSNREMFSDFEARLAKITRPNADFTLTVMIYAKSQATHDRFARVVFDFHSVSVELSRGAEVFRNEYVSEPFLCHPLKTEDFLMKSNSWPNPRTVLHTIYFPTP